eukprot:TRINITY_DN1658_c0_g1_i7.p1 TRINITY_DN1658_c0_g1~~TRINITY_DN1658_c0_g1_i7.p1  ORF type:complete len:122 (+),score=23.09 TRINITY_DN1658_c0_g1_i7:953-1318(+)
MRYGCFLSCGKTNAIKKKSFSLVPLVRNEKVLQNSICGGNKRKRKEKWDCNGQLAWTENKILWSTTIELQNCQLDETDRCTALYLVRSLPSSDLSYGWEASHKKLFPSWFSKFRSKKNWIL